MKYSFVFLIILILFSCHSSKRVISTSTKETPKVSKVKDSFSKEVPSEIIVSEPPLTSKSKEVVSLKSHNKLYQFNQITTKRFLTTHEVWDNLLQKHVLDNGTVNYKGFKNDRIYLYNYLKVLNVALPNESHPRAYKLAYWINAYNAMTVDLILRHSPIKSIKDIDKPWEQRFWKLGNKWYNLNDIEHEILRKMNEPRIHFAIVCASLSCPKLSNKAFTSTNLENQLTKATKEFLNDSEKNNLSQNNLKLSKIFQWFAKDFKQNGSIIDFLNKYTTIEISSKAKKSFKDYNWNLND